MNYGVKSSLYQEESQFKWRLSVLMQGVVKYQTRIMQGPSSRSLKTGAFSVTNYNNLIYLFIGICLTFELVCIIMSLFGT